MAPRPDEDLLIEPASDEDLVYGDYNHTVLLSLTLERGIVSKDERDIENESRGIARDKLAYNREETNITD
ncbi:hypothetical protein WR25_07813 [Diploscapter pachys]|uniref:Uncharacterized protein n=1 Tax=Diploscapter pachys TaxID=2018661 RepID=A0A2A2JPT5_9BILA|nr:hypothetical protein WR25_07813 [Diploscapter pachys]